MNVIKYLWINIIKLMLQTHKNCPKILASFFNILGTRGDKLPALIEFTPMQKTSVVLPFVTKNSSISLCLFKHFMGTSDDDSSALIEFTPLWKTKCQVTICN